jgi:serine protease Do
MRSFVRPLSSRAALLGALLCLPFFSLRAGYDLESLEGAEAKVAAVAAKAAPSVVALTHGMRTGMASGSGVIIGKNGLILTAAHVLADAKIVDVTFPDGKTTKAKVLGADHERDVALALITEPGDYPFMELGEANTLKPGEMVVALGHPGGFDPKRQAPVRFGRVFDAKSGGLIQTDCTLAGGDSGGALFDLEGKVVGVHHAVGAGMSSNLDAPASAVRKSFSRMVTGDR